MFSSATQGQGGQLRSPRDRHTANLTLSEKGRLPALTANTAANSANFLKSFCLFEVLSGAGAGAAVGSEVELVSKSKKTEKTECCV